MKGILAILPGSLLKLVLSRSDNSNNISSVHSVPRNKPQNRISHNSQGVASIINPLRVPYIIMIVLS